MLGHKSANATAVYARVDAGATKAASEIVERRLLEAQRLAVQIVKDRKAKQAKSGRVIKRGQA
jgi:hypothetical protein